MPKVEVLNIKGENVGEIELNETLFAAEIAETAVYDTVKNQLANKRQGTQSAKTRAEVRGGGRKPFRQKGIVVSYLSAMKWEVAFTLSQMWKVISTKQAREKSLVLSKYN